MGVIEKEEYKNLKVNEIEHLNRFNFKIIVDKDKGRSLISSTRIKRNTLIEISPILLFNENEYEQHGKHTALDDYTFVWPDRSGKMALALGLGSIFNHSINPNDIEVDDELCISYGPQSKLWFNTDFEPDDELKPLSDLEFLNNDFGI